MTDSDETLRERLDILDEMQKKMLMAGSGDNPTSIGDDTPLTAGAIQTTGYHVSTDAVDEIRIEHNGTEYVVVEQDDGIALERCDDDE